MYGHLIHILHFKGIGMRNLQYEMRIGQKSHNKVTKTVYVWFEFLWIKRYYIYWINPRLSMHDKVDNVSKASIFQCPTHHVYFQIAWLGERFQRC